MRRFPFCRMMAWANLACLVVTMNTSQLAESSAAMHASATPGYTRLGASHPSMSAAIQSSLILPYPATISPRSQPHRSMRPGMSPPQSAMMSSTVWIFSRSARASRVFSNPVSTTGRTSLSSSSTRPFSASAGPNTSGHRSTPCFQPLMLLSGSLSHTTPSKSRAKTTSAPVPADAEASARAIVDVRSRLAPIGARAGRSVQRRGATAEARATGIGARTTNDMELCRPESQAGTVAPLVVPTLAAVSA